MIVPQGSARLATEMHGSGDPVVLMVHAGVTDRRSWAPLVAALGGALGDVRCLTYDARTYGETTCEPESDWSPVADALAVLDAHGVDRAIVVGASAGGRTSLDLALQAPDRVAALVLIGAAVSGAPTPEVVDDAVARLDIDGDAAYDRGDLEEVNRIEAHLWLDGPLQPEGRVGDPVRELFLDMNARALAAPDPGEQADDEGAWDRLDEIGVPTLVLVGEHDLHHVRVGARHLADGIARAGLVELAGVAHLPHLEGDPTTLEAVTGFVADHASKG